MLLLLGGQQVRELSRCARLAERWQDLRSTFLGGPGILVKDAVVQVVDVSVRHHDHRCFPEWVWRHVQSRHHVKLAVELRAVGLLLVLHKQLRVDFLEGQACQSAAPGGRLNFLEARQVLLLRPGQGLPDADQSLEAIIPEVSVFPCRGPAYRVTNHGSV